jgi:hypothetical protein
MIVFHRTTEVAARAILAEGFRDASGSYGLPIVLEGVFVSDRPVDCNEGAKGDALLSIELAASENELVDFEIVEDGKTWREWIVPARLLNVGHPACVENEDHLRNARFRAPCDLDHERSGGGSPGQPTMVAGLSSHCRHSLSPGRTQEAL